MRRSGAISSFKWFLPVCATRRGRGEGVGTPWLITLKNEITRGSQRDVVYLGWPIATLVTEPKWGAWGRCGVSANEYCWAHHVTWSPNKLWRSNSVFNPWKVQIGHDLNCSLACVQRTRRETACRGKVQIRHDLNFCLACVQRTRRATACRGKYKYDIT